MKKIIYLRNAVVDLLEELQNREETLTTRGIFRLSPAKKQVTQAFKKIMKGEKANALAGQNIHFTAGLLKRILDELRALKQPVISQTSEELISENFASDSAEYLKKTNCTKALPIFNYQIICKLHALMNKISTHSDDNMMTSKSISHGLAQILFMHRVTKRKDLLIENFMKAPPPQPISSACFNKIINNIKNEIKTKTWNAEFAGGVRIDIAGQFKKVPQSVAEIYEIINFSQLSPEDKYNQIKEQAENAIIRPQLWQKKDTLEFYKKVVNDEYSLI